MDDKLHARTVEEAELYLNGKSLREISEIVNVSHTAVYYDLTKRLSKISLLLYFEVIDAMKDNAPQSIKVVEVQKRVLNSINDYIYSDKTIEQIAAKYNVSFFTTYRDLHTRAKQLANLNPENITQEMLDIIKCKLEQNSLDNLTEGNDGFYLNQPREKGRFSK